MIVVFLGPPGSGKGTQADFLNENYGFTHFDTGSRLRAEIASGSELGKRIASYTDQGNLVPIEIIRDLVTTFFASDNGQRVLFDGFPRSLEQAEVLSSSLRDSSRSLDYAIYLEIDSDSLVQRIVNRRFCPECGDIYNMISRPQASDEVCDKDGAQLIQRRDDTEEVFRHRLAVYNEQTKPVLDYYCDRGLLRTIDGDADISEVSASIVQLLELDGIYAP
jgi:adenylate kinase